MRNYENKTKEDLLEIIEQLEKKIDFLSSHSSDSSSPSKGRFRFPLILLLILPLLPKNVFVINIVPGYWMLFLTCSPSSTMTPIS